MTPRQVKERLREASHALRGLSHPRELEGLKALRVVWPAVPPDYWTNYGRDKVALKPPHPTPDQIDRLDETLSWLLWLDADERKLVGAWMARVGWANICARWGFSRTTGWKKFDSICAKIATRWLAEQIRAHQGVA